MASNERENHHRQVLNKTREAEVEGRPGTLVDLPADCHFLHLPAEAQGHVAHQISAECGEAKCSVRIVGFLYQAGKSIPCSARSNKNCSYWTRSWTYFALRMAWPPKSLLK